MDTLLTSVFIFFATNVYSSLIFNFNKNSKLFSFLIILTIALLTVVFFPKNPFEITIAIIFGMFICLCNKLREESNKPYISFIIAIAVFVFPFTLGSFYDYNVFIVLLLSLSFFILIFNETFDIYIIKYFIVFNLQHNRKYKKYLLGKFTKLYKHIYQVKNN